LSRFLSEARSSKTSFIPVAKALSFIPVNEAVKPQEPHPIHKGSPGQQEYIDYAWNTYHDKNLVYLMKAENGLISPDRKHPLKYWCPGTKSWGHDWGFGGISDCYHPQITNDPRFLTDWRWQIDQVYLLYKGGTKFYSRPKWSQMAKFFQWV
jgi:hypothetical protein